MARTKLAAQLRNNAKPQGWSQPSAILMYADALGVASTRGVVSS
jgi:hypothetical protein